VSTEDSPGRAMRKIVAITHRPPPPRRHTRWSVGCESLPRHIRALLKGGLQEHQGLVLLIVCKVLLAFYY